MVTCLRSREVVAAGGKGCGCYKAVGEKVAVRPSVARAASSLPADVQVASQGVSRPSAVEVTES